MSSYLATNYRYIVYLLIRSAVSKYRTNDTLRYAGISLPKEKQKQLRRMMRTILQQIAEDSYQDFLKSIDGNRVESVLQDLEQRGYLGGVEFRGADIMRDAIERKKRQVVGLQELNDYCDAQIQELRYRLNALAEK